MNGEAVSVTRQKIHDSLELSFTQEGQLLEYSTTVITDSNIVPDTQKVVLGAQLKLSSALASTRQESDDILELSLTQEEEFLVFCQTIVSKQCGVMDESESQFPSQALSAKTSMIEKNMVSEWRGPFLNFFLRRNFFSNNYSLQKDIKKKLIMC